MPVLIILKELRMIYMKYIFLLILPILMFIDKNGARLLAYSLFLISVMAIDYHIYLRGGESIFFVDKTQAEKDLRKIQEIEIKNKLKNLNE